MTIATIPVRTLPIVINFSQIPGLFEQEKDLRIFDNPSGLFTPAKPRVYWWFHIIVKVGIIEHPVE